MAPAPRGPCPAWPANRRFVFGSLAGPGSQPDDPPVPSLTTASTSGSEAKGALPALGASTFLAQKLAPGSGALRPVVRAHGLSEPARSARPPTVPAAAGPPGRRPCAPAGTPEPPACLRPRSPRLAPPRSPAPHRTTTRPPARCTDPSTAATSTTWPLASACSADSAAAAPRVHDSRPVTRAAAAASAASARPGPHPRSSARDRRP